MSDLILRPDATVSLDVLDDPIDADEGTVALSGMSVPYASARVDIPLVDLDALDELDSAILAGADVRAVIEAGEAVTATSRMFDLGVRAREVNHTARRITLELASDEAIAIAYTALEQSSYFTQQSSTRAIVNAVLAAVLPGAALEPGPDAPMRALTDSVNVVRNPRAAADTTDWSGSGSTLIRATSGGPTYSPTYVAVQSGGGGLLMSYSEAGVPVSGGRTYRLSCDVAADLGQIVGIDALVKDAAGTIVLDAAESPQPKNASSWQRLSITFTTPATATKAQLRVFTTGPVAPGHYLAATAWRLSEVGIDPTDTGYFDATTPSTTEYSYAAAGATSKRTALIDRNPEILVWPAGVTAWDFLTPIVAAAGLKLFCDELRAWRLVNPATYEVPGLITGSGWNAREGTDRIDRGNPEILCTGVIVRYRWRDSAGVQQERLDKVGTPGSVLEVPIDRPYPGPGLAAAILARRAGQGRTQAVNVAMNYTATPGMEAQITLPGTSAQLGRLASVEWDIVDGFMQLGTVALVDVTPDSWLGWDVDMDWDDVDAALDWEDA